MIIGGANFYQQMIDQAERMYLTHVDVECEGDAWFPEFDLSEWNIIKQQIIKSDEKNNFNFNIVTYERKK